MWIGKALHKGSLPLNCYPSPIVPTKSGSYSVKVAAMQILQISKRCMKK